VRRWSHDVQAEIRDVIETEPGASAPMPAPDPRRSADDGSEPH
jgi:hypothetical protein